MGDIATKESHSNALAPLLDMEYSQNNSDDSLDDERQTETQMNDSSDSDESETTMTTATVTNTKYSESQYDSNTDYQSTFTSNCNEVQLGLAINEFFAIIDCAGQGAVTFDILKICLKLIGIALSAYQLDILLNELTCYKPSCSISKQMMYEFLLSSSRTTQKHSSCDNVQVTLIRTEIIVGLLSNLQQQNSEKSKQNKTNSQKIKKTKRRSFISKNNRILN